MKFTLALLALLVSLESIDLDVRDALQSGRTPWLDAVMHGASNIGKPAVALGTLLAVAVLDAEGVAVARAGLLALIPTNIAVELVKRAAHRVRPDGDRNPVNASFPSSHAANAFAMATVFARRWPRASGWLWATAAVIAFSRMYLNRHYFTDVLAGAALGVGLAWWMPRLLSNALSRAALRFRRGPGHPDPERAAQVQGQGRRAVRHRRRA